MSSKPLDLSLNRVYWKYNKSDTSRFHSIPYMRPIVYAGVELTINKYVNCGNNIKSDLITLAKAFYEQHKNKKIIVALSGGIDSEITAETLYRLNIPFTAISLRLFNGRNDYDLFYAYKYCKDRGILHRIINLSLDEFVNNQLTRAVQSGQFCESLSQAALAYILDHSTKDDVVIFSGHNPDYHEKYGFGWHEDCINLVKYAINTDKNFFTFTSLESIFVHYMHNYDASFPGNKNPAFIYSSFPQLQVRKKMTGWELCNDVHYEYHRLLNKVTWKDTKEPVQVFLHWK